jgi:hypothetical protein
MFFFWENNYCISFCGTLTCSDTLVKSYISSGPRSPGAASLSAEKRNHKKYEDVANLCKFVPFAVEMETLGPFGEEARWT